MDPVERFRDEFFTDKQKKRNKYNTSDNDVLSDEGRRRRRRRRQDNDEENTDDDSFRYHIQNTNIDGSKRKGLLNDAAEEEEEIYIVRQEYAYFSYGFSLFQTIIMGLLMWQCGVAPMNINPMIGPYPDALSEWGGKNSTLIIEDGEWWRMITPILLHAGLFHLVGNIAVQMEAGAFFEKEWGSFRWLLVYLGSAVASSTLSVICMPDAVSVGSSGAVMGLFGGKLVEVLLRCCERTDTKEQQIGSKVRQEQCMTVTCSVVVVLAFSFIPYVDWAAHLGGLIGGILVGIPLFALELEYTACKCFWFIVGLAGTGLSYYMSLWFMYNSDSIDTSEDLRDVCGYYQQQFDDYECKCMVQQYVNNNNGEDGGAD